MLNPISFSHVAGRMLISLAFTVITVGAYSCTASLYRKETRIDASARKTIVQDNTNTVIFQEHFTADKIDEDTWTITRKNDFQESTIQLSDDDSDSRRLLMRAASIGTDDSTVKYHGVRTTKPVIDMSSPIELSFDIDWNDQANGCYMTAGAYICPNATDNNPWDEPDWIKFEYRGVPPGKNARLLISMKKSGREITLYTDNWPEQRSGRLIGLQHIRVVFLPGQINVWENGQKVFSGELKDRNGITHKLNWVNGAYLYLQHSTHSNYRVREIYFDNITVRQLKGQLCQNSFDGADPDCQPR